MRIRKRSVLLFCCLIMVIIFSTSLPTPVALAADGPPTLTEVSVSNVAETSATFQATINTYGAGGATIREHGFCLDTSSSPTTKVNNDGAIAKGKPFSYSATKLAPGTKYYVRAYATNTKGYTGYSPGSGVSFTTDKLADPNITEPKNEVEAGSIKIKWTSVRGAEQYKINVRDITTGDNGPVVLNAQIVSASRTYSDSFTVKSSHKYRAWVGVLVGGKTYSQDCIEFTVKPQNIPVTKVKLNKSTLSLEEGKSETLTATVEPSNATDKGIKFSSNKKAIATVDEKSGLVTAVSAGKAIITAQSTSDSSKYAQCTVTVTAKPLPIPEVKNVLISPIEGKAEEHYYFEVKVNTELSELWLEFKLPGGAWTGTDNKDKFTFDMITKTPNSDGSFTYSFITEIQTPGLASEQYKREFKVHARNSSGENNASQVYSFTVKPKNIPVTKVKLNKSTLSLEAGKSETLTATVEPGDATDKRVNFESQNKSVATVDETTGLVTAVSPGNTTIKAMSVNDPSIYASCTVIIGTEDNQCPFVEGTDPDNNAKNVELSSRTITIRFNKDIQAGSNYNKIGIICTTYNNASVPINNKNISGSQLTITRSGDWTAQNTYKVTIPSDAITDSVGNNLASAHVFSFSTGTGGGTSIGAPAITQPSTDGTRIPISSAGGFTVKWNAVSGAEHYVVAIKEEGSSSYELMDDEVYTNQYTIGYLLANLFAGRNYIIEVLAVKGTEITKSTRRIVAVTAAPEILAPTQSTVDINNIDISWKGVWAGAAQTPSYKISFFDIASNQAITNYTNIIISSTSYTLPASAAVENHQYRVTVTGINEQVEGESTSLEFTINKSSDTEKPYVESTVPADGGKATVALGELKVNFNENILTGPNISSITVARAGMNSLGVTSSISGKVMTLTISNLGTPFAAGYTYTATIPAGAVKDVAGNASTAYQFSITIESSGDGASPYVVSTNPGDGQSNVKPNQNIIIIFNEPIKKKGPVLIGNATYGDATNRTNQVLDDSGRILTISRNDGHLWGTGLTYTADIPLGNITDIAGNEMADTFTFSFTISSDSTAPTINSSNPANGSLDIPLNTSVTITFSEPISLIGNLYQKIEIINTSNNKSVYFKAAVSNNKLILSRGDGGQWNANTEYCVIIHPGAVQDIIGNSNSANTQIKFTTVKIPAKVSFTYYPSQPLTEQSVRFNASSTQAGSNTIESYNWDFGDGCSATGISPSHVYTSSGQYSAVLGILLDDGSTKSTSQIISIGEPEAEVRETPGPQQEYRPGGGSSTSIKADQEIRLPDGRIQYSGNININQYLKLDGKLLVDEVNLEITGSGCLYVEATQGNFHGQIDLFKGDFTLNAETGELLKQMGLNKLQIAGLNVEINSMRLLSNGVKVAGQLELPGFVGGSKVSIDNLQIINNKIDYEGRIKLPNMKVGKSSLGLKNAYMEYNSTENRFVGHAILEIPKLFGVEGKIGLVNAQLNEVGFGLDGMNIAIDATGFFINRLYGELGGLAQPPLRIVGEADITGGPKVYGLAAIEGKNLSLTVDVSGIVSGSGNLKLFSFDLAKGSFDLDKNTGFSVTATLKALDIIEANLDLQCDKSLHLQGKAQGCIHIPSKVPWIGGMEISDAVLSIHDGGINTDIQQGIFKVGFWMKWNGQFGVSGRITIWDKKRSAGYAITSCETESRDGKEYVIMDENSNSIDVPYGQNQAIIRLTWEGEGDTDFSLSGPDGETFTPENSPLDSVNGNYFKNTEQKEAFYVIANPAGGCWTYTLSNTSLSLYEIEVYQINNEPILTITNPAQDIVSSGSVQISWSSDTVLGSTLNLYYSPKDQQTIGTLIAGGLDPATASYEWDTTTVQNGDYYIYAVLDYGCEDPVVAWAAGKVVIENLAAPSAPQGLGVQAVNGRLRIAWTPNSETDLEGYRIYLFDSQDQLLESTFVSFENNSFEWNGLECNQSYRIALRAINCNSLESSLSPIIDIFLPQPVPPSLKVTWPAVVNSQAEVIITGIIEAGANGVLFLNGSEYVSGITQAFQQKVELNYGRNELLLVASKSNGDEAREAFECWYDSTPPQLIVNNISQEMEVSSPDLQVSGMVEPAANLTINNIPVEIKSDGTFSTIINLMSGYNHIYLEARDEAGNSSVFNGMVLCLDSANQPPEAKDIIINGLPNVGETLTAQYIYFDLEGDQQGESIYRWYRDNSVDGSGRVEISGATAQYYTLCETDFGKYIFVEVIPIAVQGTGSGTAVLSRASEQIGRIMAAPLKDLSIKSGKNGAELLNDFNANKYNYLIKVGQEVDTVIVTVNQDQNTMVKVFLGDNEIKDGIITLIEGTNSIKIVVSDANKADRSTTINIIRGTIDECFIATAAFGSKFTWPVVLLRQFRDQYLLTNSLGTAFVDFYYRHSPPIAAFIAGSQPLKILVRVLLAPIIGLVYTIYHPQLLVVLIFLVILLTYCCFRQQGRYVCK